MSPVKEMAGRVYYATASKEVEHGAPAEEDNFGGIAIKQQARDYDAASPAYKTIAVGEDFAILVRGEVEIAADHANGTLLYIDPDDNTVTETSTNNVVLGRVTNVAGERGTPAGHIRVNLDIKS